MVRSGRRQLHEGPASRNVLCATCEWCRQRRR
jgi:hypothetical protein